jgi:quercetin dioxygenase-like cupin family protein
MMNRKDTPDESEQEIVHFPNFRVDTQDTPWYQHPEWDGVFLKDLIGGKDTGGAFSYHLVQVWKDCRILDHDHATQWEWNRVISGKGVFTFGDAEIPFVPGQTFVTPPGVRHGVRVYHSDLTLLAMFVPALV